MNGIASDGVGVVFRPILYGVIAQNHGSRGGQFLRQTKRSALYEYFLRGVLRGLANAYMVRSLSCACGSTGFDGVAHLRRFRDSIVDAEQNVHAIGLYVDFVETFLRGQIVEGDMGGFLPGFESLLGPR